MAGSGSVSGSGVVLTGFPSSVVWGVPEAVDTSISVQGVACRATSDSRNFLDRVGVIFGTAAWNFRMTMDIDAIVLDPSAGLMAESLGSLIVLAAITSLGVGGLGAGGATVLRGVDTTYKNTDVLMVRISAEYLPDLPAGSTQVRIAGVGAGG